LDSNELEELFQSFPIYDSIAEWMNIGVPLEEARVSPEEVKAALKRGNTGNTPVSDGVCLRFLRCMPESLIDYVADTFLQCLSVGVFPRSGKRTRLVLIPKAKGKTVGEVIKAQMSQTHLPN